MSGRIVLAIVVAALIATGFAWWAFGDIARDPDSAVVSASGQPVAETGVIEPELLPVVDAARAASAQALADAGAADAVAKAADAVAARAARFSADGKAAAEAARKAAGKACKSPGDSQGCATAADGARYEGAQSCRADGCGPHGYGVFTDARRGWESQGQWNNWSMVLGCDWVAGVMAYCGQQAASAWSGFGISYNSKAAAISAEWLGGKGMNPVQLDYPTGSRMRGDMVDYELNGPGVYERADGRVLRGRWQAGKLVSGIVSYPGTGDAVSGVFQDGHAQTGSITYRDGRTFVGEIEDGPALAQARPRRGVLYAPGGQVEAQGAWSAAGPSSRRSTP